MSALRVALFAFGYPVSIAVISRWIPVVRQQRIRWFIIHQIAVAAIVLGQALRHRAIGVALNGSWFVIAAIWYIVVGRTQRSRTVPA